MEMDVSLAKNVAATSYDTLPYEVVEATKKSILDTLGVMLAASSLEPSCQAIIDIAREQQGIEESTILIFGGKTTCTTAAFANGSLTHALDYDDSYTVYTLRCQRTFENRHQRQ